MGCDIHCYVEYRVKEPKNDWEKQWRNFGKRINPGRNCYVFGALAGVRSPTTLVAPVRGYPDDAGWARGDFRCV